MFGGALALKNEAQMESEVVGFFMFMTFILVLTVEVYLCRLLSKLGNSSDQRAQLPQVIAPQQPMEIRGAQPRSLPEPIPSVTENTTRTLQYQEASKR